MKRSLKDYLVIALKGMGMGAADVIPGVSGGTIAFIVGIYEELIESIKSINLKSLKLLFTLKLREFWKAINGSFLLTLVLGIVASFLLLAKTMTWLLENERVLTYAFFFGLILVSTYYVSKRIKVWNASRVIIFIVGGALAFWVTSVSPAQTPNDLWFIFLCGAIAICAMILPGISGSFILLLLGKYQYMMQALSDLDIVVILVFALGAIIGITSFSRVLSWLFKKWHDMTIAILAGFMLGSLNKIWPWKNTASNLLNSLGVDATFVEKNVWPNEQILPAILLFLVGCGIVILIETLSNRKEKKVK